MLGKKVLSVLSLLFVVKFKTALAAGCTITYDEVNSCVVSDSTGCVANSYYEVSGYLVKTNMNGDECELADTNENVYVNADNNSESNNDDFESCASVGSIIKYTTGADGKINGKSYCSIAIDDCSDMMTECANGEEADGFCISGNTIKGINTAASCILDGGVSANMKNGINVIYVKSDFTLDVDTWSSGNGKGLIMIDCEDTDNDGNDTCKQTFGYYLDQEDVYKMGITESGKLIPEEETTSATDCAGKIGSIIYNSSKKYLCLTENKSVELKATAAGSNYLMKKLDGNIFVENDDTTKVSIVIKASNNALTFNNIYNDEEYCVNDSNEVMGRIENFCEGTVLDNLYSCSEGLCELEKTPLTEAGQYVHNGELYICTGTRKITCTKDVEGTSDGIIIAQKLETTDNLPYEKSIGKTVLEGVTDINNVEILLYHCVKGQCQRTEGFIKHNSSFITNSYCPNNDKCTNASADLTIDGTATIDHTDFYVYDYDDVSKTEVKIAIPPINPVTYFYIKDGSHFVMIDTIKDEDNNDLLAVGIVPNTNIPGKVIVSSNYVVSAECARYYRTYTVTANGNSVNEGEECKVPCEFSQPQTCKEGYYLSQTTNGLLSNGDEQEGTIYYCDGVNDCHILTTGKKVGYYLNADTVTEGAPAYIKCTTTGSESCTSVAATEANTCESKNIGDIIKSVDGTTTTYKLCLQAGPTGKTADIAVITSDNASSHERRDSEIKKIDQYFINESALDGESNSELFIIIDLDGKNVFKNVSETITYRYTNDGYKVRYRNDQNDVCGAEGVKATIYEYIIEDTSRHVYKEGKKSSL